MPVFFFFFTIGSLQRFAEQFGLVNWKAFVVPMTTIFAVTGGSAGFTMVTDIESGYFDKLLLTPANRFSILLGAMAADFLRIVAQGALITVVALAVGTEFETGLVGAAVMAAIASLWGFGYSAIGFALALKTGNSQVVGSMWAFQVPLIFLTTAFAPIEALSGWLRTAVTFNPLTYLLDGMRALSMRGWELREVAISIGVAAVTGAATLALALRALLGRVR
jgi:ABC-2 type transport system permease protein